MTELVIFSVREEAHFKIFGFKTKTLHNNIYTYSQMYWKKIAFISVYYFFTYLRHISVLSIFLTLATFRCPASGNHTRLTFLSLIGFAPARILINRQMNTTLSTL